MFKNDKPLYSVDGYCTEEDCNDSATSSFRCSFPLSVILYTAFWR